MGSAVMLNLDLTHQSHRQRTHRQRYLAVLTKYLRLALGAGQRKLGRQQVARWGWQDRHS